VVSIETGMVSALCVDCSAGSRRGQPASAAKIDAADLFRSGFRMTAWTVAVVAAIAYWQRGIFGLQRTAMALFDPAILFALVPLAFLLGAVRARFLALVRRLVSERSAAAGS
jgi:hypothetical protein